MGKYGRRALADIFHTPARYGGVFEPGIINPRFTVLISIERENARAKGE